MKRKLICAVALAVVLAVLSGCAAGGEKEIKIDVNEVYESIAAKVTMPEMMTLSEKRMLNFLGIDSQQCVQYAVYVCADNLCADEVWMVEAVDAEAADLIEELAKGRLERKAAENKDYLPDQYEIVQKGQIIRSGNYVMLFVSPEVDTVVEIFNEAAGIN